MKHIILILLLLNILALISCKKDKTQQLPESKAVAIVGDEVVTEDLFKAFLHANGISQINEKSSKQALDKLIEEVAMANVADKKNIQLSTQQLNTLKYLHIKTLASAAKLDYLSQNPITDDDVLKEYNQTTKQVGGTQYHVRHVLFNDEVKAIKEREKITSVNDYLSYESDYLKDNSSMSNVGDLGWVTLGQLPVGFRNAIEQAQDKSVLIDVVNSQFGAHIVLLQETKKLQPPNFDDVKVGILNSLKAKKLSKFSQLAKAKAHVKIKN